MFQSRNYSDQTFPQFFRIPPEPSPNYEIVNSKQETILIKPFLDFSGCRRNLHVRPWSPWVRPRNRTSRSRMLKTEIPDDYTHDGRCDTPASVTREFSHHHTSHTHPVMQEAVITRFPRWRRRDLSVKSARLRTTIIAHGTAVRRAYKARSRVWPEWRNKTLKLFTSTQLSTRLSSSQLLHVVHKSKTGHIKDDTVTDVQISFIARRRASWYPHLKQDV